MKGVINLRGSVIPIFDLRSRFSMDLIEPTEKNVVIIIAIGSKTLGILVDSVSDILTVRSSEIKAAPTMETKLDDNYIEGLISIDNKMVVILNISHIFSKEDMNTVENSISEIN